MQNGTLLAALDLGSNSFRLEIGRLEHGQIRRTEYLKEVVRQGNGLDEARNLTPEAMQRGLDCLARFGERLAGFKKHQVRAVATQTLREARNREEFLARGHEVLGFPIDVIPGREEARLIYQGVARLLPQSDEKRLVVDIGGRSTEMILGQGYEARVMDSFRVGSVAWSMRYFPKGEFKADAFRVAQIAAKAVLDEALDAYGKGRWTMAYGASGTVGAVADMLTAAGWAPGVIPRAGLTWLMDKLLEARTVDRLRIEGMKDDRKLVIGGGLSVLLAVFDLLGIEEMHAADGALRHGVLYDLMERDGPDSDVRSASVRRLALKFDTDAAQSRRVGAASTRFFEQLQKSAGQALDDADRLQRKLGWAAQLHEIGFLVSHSDYHRHGAYVLEHADAPGFATPELHRLGLLVLGHRGKLRKLEAELSDAAFAQQLLALRLAVILCHARRDPDLQGLQLSAKAGQPARTLSCRAGWADAFPQSAHLLREEAAAWNKTPWPLHIQGL
ncbi:Ppx/GppA phosphatase family protein [Pseudorhodoferax sp. Leaf267]|uniref:Ppx/GppA phosphatase family protein n=1 Tax=Pseudorhodoferax sp. Leaf267 TaxID=1736316 RepID=UPI0007009FB0|nr:Ppx/GppA phosphatase family protein [Pseudorhodoferax sp. Leaf267]KQP22872.1 exopolyphosphatase [Pseudorhodoferax sp. Leaf267]